jgi:prepilin-type N-terminal cleavage/methylation domain-containing protein
MNDCSACAAPARRTPRERGLSLVEILVAAAIVAIALLSHAATTLAGHRLTVAEENRSVALQFVRDFVERLRSDEDWEGLYSRIDALQRTAGGTKEGEGGQLNLVSAYYGDLEVPGALGTVGALVEAPVTVVGPSRQLREDASAPAFGLPYDLNGDGVVGSADCSADYRALPVLVTLRWEGAGDVEQSIRVATWLRGER